MKNTNRIRLKFSLAIVFIMLVIAGVIIFSDSAKLAGSTSDVSVNDTTFYGPARGNDGEIRISNTSITSHHVSDNPTFNNDSSWDLQDDKSIRNSNGIESGSNITTFRHRASQTNTTLQVSSGVSVSTSARPETCAADLNGDRNVNLADLAIFVRNYNKENIDCSLDIVGNDCRLNLRDLSVIAREYGNSCDSVPITSSPAVR